MFTTVESSTTMSCASATVTSVHQRRVDAAGCPGAAGGRAGEVCDMRASIYETGEFRISFVQKFI